MCQLDGITRRKEGVNWDNWELNKIPNTTIFTEIKSWKYSGALMELVVYPLCHYIWQILSESRTLKLVSLWYLQIIIDLLLLLTQFLWQALRAPLIYTPGCSVKPGENISLSPTAGLPYLLIHAILAYRRYHVLNPVTDIKPPSWTHLLLASAQARGESGEGKTGPGWWSEMGLKNHLYWGTDLKGWRTCVGTPDLGSVGPHAPGVLGWMTVGCVWHQLAIFLTVGSLWYWRCLEFK